MLKISRLPAPRPSARRAGALLLPLLALLAACEGPGFLSQPLQARGNRVDAEQVAQLVPGTSTRADALALLGSPTARAAFDDNTWIYIGELTKPVIAATNRVEDQQAVTLNFDERGVLRRIERKTSEDAVPVSVVARSTPTPGNDISFLQLLLGNVGRFSPAGVPSSSRGNY